MSRTPTQIIGSMKSSIQSLTLEATRLETLLEELKQSILADDIRESERLEQIRQHLNAISELMSTGQPADDLVNRLKASRDMQFQTL